MGTAAPEAGARGFKASAPPREAPSAGYGQRARAASLESTRTRGAATSVSRQTGESCLRTIADHRPNQVPAPSAARSCAATQTTLQRCPPRERRPFASPTSSILTQTPYHGNSSRSTRCNVSSRSFSADLVNFRDRISRARLATTSRHGEAGEAVHPGRADHGLRRARVLGIRHVAGRDSPDVTAKNIRARPRRGRRASASPNGAEGLGESSGHLSRSTR
jgi:hypothetical protein